MHKTYNLLTTFYYNIPYIQPGVELMAWSWLPSTGQCPTRNASSKIDD
jgi:hypothetical protein